jgi:pimeloyl-ACP methyl ester carboxylesterase/gamma-glutamylcyclotransferase (GGCT)/AIG2-like uncharacterized protein YtfP
VTRFLIMGTFMRGQPGHGNLGRATFLGPVRTAPRYRLWFVDGRWPALVPDEHGVSIDGELYEVDEPQLDRLATLEPPGWARGPVELADGTAAAAFLGHPDLRSRGVDVSSHGGWAEFVAVGSPARVRIGDVELAVRTWGEGPRTVLFWHALGLLTSGAYASQLAPELVPDGYRVVAPDGPGHGDSPTLPLEGYALPALTELCVALLDAVGAERAVFVGHSWGAMLGAHVAAAHPERIEALVLLDAGHSDPSEQPGYVPGTTLEQHEQRSRNALAVRWDDQAALEAEVRPLVRGWSDDLARTFRAATRIDEDGRIAPATDPAGRARVYAALYDASVTRTWPALAASGIPVLLLVATEPAEVEELRARAVERFSAALPEADVVRVQGGHDLIADAAPRVAAVVRDWLSSARSRGG